MYPSLSNNLNRENESQMITIIAGTNRADSMTLKVANIYNRILLTLTDEVQLLSLENREVWQRAEDMRSLESQFLIPAQKFLFIMPEYNASFPGILKVMMDNSDVKKCWWYKKAALVGLSDGRAGNVRGTEHMTAILNYMKVNVLHHKLLISRVNEEIDSNSNVIKPETALLINKQIEEFLSF
jgi:chromate reductase, NAD(P)H dehydrogenase (quinone)